MRPPWPLEITSCCKVVKAWIAPQVVLDVMLIDEGVISNVYDSSTPCCRSAELSSILRSTAEMDEVLLAFAGGKVSKIGMGASVACGTHFKFTIASDARFQASRMALFRFPFKDIPLEIAMGPDVPHVIEVGAGSGLT